MTCDALVIVAKPERITATTLVAVEEVFATADATDATPLKPLSR